jgi:hypothetical protein
VDGHNRSAVTLATSGGNQSWTGVREPLDRRDSTISSCTRAMAVGGSSLLTVIEAQTAITLGGPRYSEFEIEPGRPIHELVYAVDPALESDSRSGEYPSGQRTATVNRQAQPSQVRILPPPFRPRPGFRPSKYDRKLGRGGEAVVNQKRRVTIPRQACVEARLQDGDRVRVRSDGDGRIVLERIEPPPRPAGASILS